MDIFRGDIYYIKGGNTWSYDNETLDKDRPAIIVSNDKSNKTASHVEVVFLTTKEKKPMPTHVEVICHSPSTALCETIQTVNKDNLLQFVRACTDEEMKNIDDAIMYSLGINVEAAVENRCYEKEQEYKEKINVLRGRLEELMNGIAEEKLLIENVKGQRDAYMAMAEGLTEKLLRVAF